MPHPTEGDLQAYLDGELASAATLQCAIHLRRCPTCRLALRGIRERSNRVTDLLVLTHPRAPRREHLRWYALAAAGVFTAGVFAALFTVTLRQQPATHTRLAGATRVQDVCCFNLDGGPQRDDGMLTVSRAGQVVDCVVLYEDRAGKRAFSPHDPLRFISQPEGCTRDLIAEAGS